MGQILPNDQHSYIDGGHSGFKSEPKPKYKTLQVCPGVEVPFYDIVYKQQNSCQIEYIFKFLEKGFVSVNLTRKVEEHDHDGVPFVSANENVFGYKQKNSEKSRKQILFKMRITGEHSNIINVFAEMKLLSILEVGPYLGSLPNNTDAYLTDKYIEYWGEVAPDFRDPEPDKWKERLESAVERMRERGLRVDENKISQLSFSPFQKIVIAKVHSNPLPKNRESKQLELSNDNLNNSSSMCSIKSATMRNIRREFDEQSFKVQNALDSKTNSMTILENLLFQKNIDRAIEQFEDVASNIENRKEKLVYSDKFCNLLSESIYFKEYEEQIITEALATSFILNNISITLNESQSVYNRKLEERLNKLRMGSTEFGSEKELESYSQIKSIEGSELKLEQLKINIQGNNKNRVKEIIREIKEKDINQKIQLSYEINFEYGMMLMKSRKSRHALVLFTSMSHQQEVPQRMKAKIFNLMGMIYYNRDHHQQARREFENSLSKLLKIRCYCPQMAMVFNNIGCTLYKLNMYDTCLEYFNRSLSLSASCCDYKMMARSNRAVALMDKNLLKEARNEFIEIIKLYEPANNASILCKTFTNLGYLELLEKNLPQASLNLEYANKIQASCLLPNGYKPSIYLHNNLAILHYRKGDKRKALAHMEKCKDQIETLKGMEAVSINFNFAMINKELFFHEHTIYHLAECRRLLYRMGEGERIRWLGKIEAQIERINGMIIVEDSEESSCYNRQSFTSRYSNNMKHL